MRGIFGAVRHLRLASLVGGDGGELLRDGADFKQRALPPEQLVVHGSETCGPVKSLSHLRSGTPLSQLRRATVLSRAGGASRLPTAARGVGGALSVDDARPGQPWSSTRPCSCATLCRSCTHACPVSCTAAASLRPASLPRLYPAALPARAYPLRESALARHVPTSPPLSFFLLPGGRPDGSSRLHSR